MFWLRVIVPGLLSVSLTSAAAAHSWYPSRCCDGRDCAPVDSMETSADGTVWMEAQGILVMVPRFFPAEISPDNRAHVCAYYDYDTALFLPRCLFVPGTS